MTDQLEISVLNRASEIARVQDQLEAFAAAHQFPPRKLHELQLALEEHLANIVNHGFDDAAEHLIGVGMGFAPSELRIQVQDDGHAFNPLEHPTPELGRPIEQRPIGGLGIYMMRKSLDGLEYRREDGKNILLMIKRS